MLLFVVGPVNPDEIMNLIRSNQAKKQYSNAPEIQRYFEEEPETVNNKKQELKMNVQTPKCYVGIKSKKVHQQGREMLKHELALNMVLEILFGKSSNNYEELITSGLIDDTFQYDITFEQGFGFGYVGSDTNDPDALSGRLQTILLEAKNGQYLSDEALQRIKKKRIGGFLRSMNSPEFIANQFTRYTFNGMNLFDTVSVLEELHFDYVKEAAKQFIEENRITVCQVVPKK